MLFFFRETRTKPLDSQKHTLLELFFSFSTFLFAHRGANKIPRFQGRASLLLPSSDLKHARTYTVNEAVKWDGYRDLNWKAPLRDLSPWTPLDLYADANLSHIYLVAEFPSRRIYSRLPPAFWGTFPSTHLPGLPTHIHLSFSFSSIRFFCSHPLAMTSRNNAEGRLPDATSRYQLPRSDDHFFPCLPCVVFFLPPWGRGRGIPGRKCRVQVARPGLVCVYRPPIYSGTRCGDFECSDPHRIVTEKIGQQRPPARLSLRFICNAIICCTGFAVLVEILSLSFSR